jgi:plasmid stability protein
MGQMLIRQLDDETLARLKARAKANDRSAEAEARLLLKESLGPVGRSSIVALAGSGRRENRAGMTPSEISAHIRALREEWDG